MSPLAHGLPLEDALCVFVGFHSVRMIHHELLAVEPEVLGGIAICFDQPNLELDESLVIKTVANDFNGHPFLVIVIVISRTLR